MYIDITCRYMFNSSEKLGWRVATDSVPFIKQKFIFKKHTLLHVMLVVITTINCHNITIYMFITRQSLFKTANILATDIFQFP